MKKFIMYVFISVVCIALFLASAYILKDGIEKQISALTFAGTFIFIMSVIAWSVLLNEILDL